MEGEVHGAASTPKLFLTAEDAEKWYNETPKIERLQAGFWTFSEEALTWLVRKSGASRQEMANFNKEVDFRNLRKRLRPAGAELDLIDLAKIKADQIKLNEERAELEKLSSSLEKKEKKLEAKKRSQKEKKSRKRSEREESSDEEDTRKRSKRVVDGDAMAELASLPSSASQMPSVAFLGSARKAPMWRDADSARAADIFVREYEHYALETKNLQTAGGVSVPVLSVFNCMDAKVRQRLYDEPIGEKLSTATNEELLEYIKTSRVTAAMNSIDLSKEPPIMIKLEGNLPIPTVSKWIGEIREHLEYKNADFYLTSENKAVKKMVGEYLLKGIQPPTLLVDVRNELQDKMDKISKDLVIQALTKCLEKVNIYINSQAIRGTNKESVMVRGDRSRDRDRVHGSFARNFRPPERNMGYSNYGRMDPPRFRRDPPKFSQKGIDGQPIRKPLPQFDEAHPPAGLHLEIDPTDKNSGRKCALCMSREHFIKDCKDATHDQKQWYTAWVRKKWREKDDKLKSKYNVGSNPQ